MSRLRPPARIVAAFTTAAWLLGPQGVAIAPQAAPPGGVVRLAGHVAAALSEATPLSPSGEQADEMLLTFVLRRSDEAAFKAYLRDVYDPASPAHGRFLARAQLTERFGPAREAYDELLAFLRGQGFELVAGSDNRVTMSVRGTRAAAERALAVHIGDYELGGRRFHANDRDPALPPDLASHVQAIAGLSNLAQPRPAEISISDAATICSIVAALVGLVWWPAAFVAAVCAVLPIADPFSKRKIRIRWSHGPPTVIFPSIGPLSAKGLASPLAFDVAPGARVATGAGQTIGITSFSGFDVGDVRDWLDLMGAPPEQLDRLSRVSLGGGAPVLPSQVEPLLDVAAAMSVARDADVVVYDAPFTGAGTSFQALLNRMIDDGVDVITNSWAYCESDTTRADVESIDAILQTAAAAGISVFSASGDMGSTCLNGSANTAHVPASSPNLTAVGGTTETLGPGATYGSEAWWNGAGAVPPTGQGGFGVSRFFGRPPYQDGLNAQPARWLPDVAVNADPVTGFILCQASDGGCPTGKLYGGTSVAAPIWAGFAALLNEARGGNLGFLNPLLYPLADTDAFHDATSMGSDFAHVGLGSPNLEVLSRLLNGIDTGTPDAAVSESVYAEAIVAGVRGFPEASIPADGASAGVIVVSLADAASHTVGGKTVALAADSANAVIAPAGPVTTDANGQAVFTVTNLVSETATFTATTGGVVLDQKPSVTFGVPPATRAGISAFPSTVTANGTSTTTITITLQDVLGRPTPGKLVRLAQGGGHSIITGPVPSVTDGSGQIQFLATNLVNETVAYTAVDVTDGELPVPGSAPVVFNNGAGTGCPTTPPRGENGYVVTPFASGFQTGPLFYSNINFGGCNGASGGVFRNDSTFFTNSLTGEVFRLGLEGGVVSSANRLATIGPTLLWLVIGKDGRLYATRAGTGTSNSGVILELDPQTGGVLRTLASNLRCPFSLAVDPLSGDLFFDGGCSGVSADANIYRVRNPASATPTVEVYATLSTTPNGYLSFAPNGTLYVVTDYFNPTPGVARVSGTNGPTPPTVTPLPGLTSFFWVNVAESNAAGEATSIILLTSQGLELVDITTTPPGRTLIATGIGGGSFGPDGCLYAGLATGLYRVTNAQGGCSFDVRSTSPALTLAPDVVSPDPVQGTEQTFTAKFRNLTVPAGTPVLFDVSGPNATAQMVRTDAAGQAALRYAAARPGTDVIVATATVNDSTLTSNRARATWTPGKHTTFLSLNPSVRAGAAGQPVAVSASLSDISADPPTSVAAAGIDFALGAVRCSAPTDAQGLATCQLTPAEAGMGTLTATFAATAELLGATDAIGFNVTAGASTTTTVPGGTTTTTTLPPAPCAGVDCNDSDGCTSDRCVEGACQHVLPPGFDGVSCYLEALKTALGDAAPTDVRAAVKKKLLAKIKQTGKLVRSAQRPGRRGAKALRKLGKKVDGLASQLERFRGRKIGEALDDTLIGLARRARSAMP